MSVLTVNQLVVGLDINGLLVNHDLGRVAVLTGGAGNFVVAESVAFSLSGAVGRVIAWDSGTKTLTYSLTSVVKPIIRGDAYVVEPRAGDVLTGGTSGATGTLVTDAPNADSWVNDGRTFLFVSNASGSPVDLIALPTQACNHDHFHAEVFTIAPGFFGPAGPFSRQQFNKSTGLMSVAYSGSTAAGDLGVAAVRMFPPNPY